MTALETAQHYGARGWSVVPIPTCSKNPGYKGWEQTRLKEADLHHHFNGHPQNIGVLLGEPSGWLIDVDLDHTRCVARAGEFLPPTPAVFGRSGKPRSHWLYRITRPAVTRKFKSKLAGMLVEFRSTGAQTVFPSSTHESGEPIEWETDGAEPALVDPEELLAAVTRLANAIKIELGEKVGPKVIPPKPANVVGRSDNDDEQPCLPDGEEQEDDALSSAAGRRRKSGVPADALRAMLRMKVRDQNDGSGRLFAAACRAVEHDLPDEEALAAIKKYAAKRPFPRDWTDEQILDRVRDAEKKVTRGVIGHSAADDKVKILIDTEEFRAISETVGALAGDETIFQRGGTLVRVLREVPADHGIHRAAGSATITFLPQPTLRERMTKRAEFVQLVRRGDVLAEVLTHPTQWLVTGVDARGDWPGIRTLTGISDVPVLRADGTLWQTPGYDLRTGVLYEPSGVFPPVDDEVTLDDAVMALQTLLEVVVDFQFESDEHRSAWLAGLLTPLARFAFDGPAPLFLIDANVRGAGKGLLAQTFGEIVMGREMPVSSYAHESEEMRKKVTAIALAGDRMIHLDNLEGNFGNDTLDRALTATRWKDRILGKSQEVDLPLIPVWYGTGNNVAVAADTTRRVIHIRLDVLEEKPEERGGFKHPELLSWVRRQRGRLLSAALTILRAYCRAGRPRQDLSPFGSFEGWSRLVREAVVWVGMPDPCLTRIKLAEHSDTTADALGQTLAAWKSSDPMNAGIVVSELLNRLYAKEFAPRDDAAVAMRAALENMVGCPPGRAPSPRQVAAKLKQFRRRVVEREFLDFNPNEYHRQGSVWRVHHV